MPEETTIPNELQRFMQSLNTEEPAEGHWVFTVYTTYPLYPTSTAPTILISASDEDFDKNVCDRFQSHIEAYLRFTIEEPYGLRIPLDIEYIRLPSASLHEARTHFRAKYGWPENYETGLRRSHKYHGMRHRYFIVVDEESIRKLFGADVPAEVPKGLNYMDMTRSVDDIVIKVVEVDYDEACEGKIIASASRRPVKGSSNCVTYYGFINTTPRWLREIWGEAIDEGFDHIFRHKDLIYKG